VPAENVDVAVTEQEDKELRSEETKADSNARNEPLEQ